MPLDPEALSRQITAIDAWLPQTQCTQCGFPHCRLYAEAIAKGEADINQCPPGGDTTIHALATLLAVAVKPLNPVHGAHLPRQIAVIDEHHCIGCTLCIKACPVDAILGAVKQMHTVIQQECTGCGLCIAPCPVECITLQPNPVQGQSPWPDYTQAEVVRARFRCEQRLLRLQRKKAARLSQSPAAPAILNQERAAKKAEIQAALTRVKKKRPPFNPYGY